MVVPQASNKKTPRCTHQKSAADAMSPRGRWCKAYLRLRSLRGIPGQLDADPWRYMATGEGLALASASIVVKTLVLYLIMVTGSIWEREVFGCYLFARPFFWEDVVSMFVIALHTAYVAAYLSNSLMSLYSYYLL